VWKLDGWARQGVLLLNPVLTVEVGRIGSHMNCGWQGAHIRVVKALCSLPDPPVFLLWGKAGERLLRRSPARRARTPVLRTRHPSHDFQRQFMAEGSHFLATAEPGELVAL
jgi:uracil-DNA glycosylase